MKSTHPGQTTGIVPRIIRLAIRKHTQNFEELN